MEIVAGLDEAGRGPLAGPVVAAGVILPKDYNNPDIRDSKQLNSKKRTQLSTTIKDVALAYAIVGVGPRRIEKINIYEATRLAMLLVVRRLGRLLQPTLIRIDGPIRLDTTIPQEAIIRGDQLHIEIAAASILAKVWRDELMQRLGAKYPGYGFEQHSGYPTNAHRGALLALGACAAHRVTFKGVANSQESEIIQQHV